MPSEDQRADWERQRQEELAEAIEDYPGELQRYERNLGYWQDAGERRRRNMRERPERPIEPSDENFSWPDLESRRLFVVGPQNRFASESEYSLWLYEVPETEVVFQGLSECACMGTVAFDTEIGKVTAVRVGNTFVDERGNRVDQHPDGLSSTDRLVRSAPYVEPPSDYALDPRIPREMIVSADFRPVQRLSNWYGETINRVVPYPGLFGYEQDRMVDLRDRQGAAEE